MAADQDVEGRNVEIVEEPRRNPGDAQMLGPVRRPELELWSRGPDVIERHSHRARHLVERIAPPFEI